MANKFHATKSSVKPPATGARGSSGSISTSQMRTANWPGLPGPKQRKKRDRAGTAHVRDTAKMEGLAHNPLPDDLLRGAGSLAKELGIRALTGRATEEGEDRGFGSVASEVAKNVTSGSRQRQRELDLERRIKELEDELKKRDSG